MVFTVSLLTWLVCQAGGTIRSMPRQSRAETRHRRARTRRRGITRHAAFCRRARAQNRGPMAEDYVRQPQRGGRAGRRPIAHGDAHLSAAATQRARVSDRRSFLLPSSSERGVTASETAYPLNCYLLVL